jgi:hypothetical protein
MARPRVFVSSTFYDLRHVRNDIERFITGLGYEPVMNERGSIPYGNIERLEQYCYREIQGVDILVSIIGNRFGSESHSPPYSVGQYELKTAHTLGKQIYLFVEANVLAEYRTFSKNKHLEAFQCSYVDDRRVYEFIEEVEKYPANNAMTAFDSTRQITDFLREQWSGLFQRFLQEQNRAKEVQVIQQLQETAQTLDKLVTYLASENRNTAKSFMTFS